MLTLLKLILATWRLTAMLEYETGPFRVFERLRIQAAVFDPKENHIGGVVSCFWCGSVWMAGLVLILDRISPGVVNVLALSAGAILYDKHTS